MSINLWLPWSQRSWHGLNRYHKWNNSIYSCLITLFFKVSVVQTAFCSSIHYKYHDFNNYESFNCYYHCCYPTTEISLLIEFLRCPHFVPSSQAFDDDIGENSLVTYSLVEHNEEETLFSIDSYTGEVVTTHSLEEQEAGGQFEFDVMATDPDGSLRFKPGLSQSKLIMRCMYFKRFVRFYVICHSRSTFGFGLSTPCMINSYTSPCCSHINLFMDTDDPNGTYLIFDK